MKIVEIKTEEKKIALKTPFITALRRVDNIEFVRVSVTDENGNIGLGEAPATKAITGEGIENILDSIADVKNILISQILPDALKLLHEKTICNIGSSARAALDMALLSLIAESKSLPMYKYLGAKDFTPLKTDVTISLKTTSEMLEDAKSAFENGLDILKVKLGADIEHAIEVTKSIREELPFATIIIDANQAWNLQTTLKFIDAVLDSGIELIEQPVIASDLESLKIITDYSDIPILADEAVFSLEDAQKVVETKSADMINIKLMKCGGVTKAVEILEFCRANSVKCMLGSMLEGPISINAALHLAMAYSDVIKYIDLDSPLLYKEMSDELEFVFNENTISLRI
jgi:L-alanine-DL-glutamate epimerase-like enolase superfamily enzyme